MPSYPYNQCATVRLIFIAHASLLIAIKVSISILPKLTVTTFFKKIYVYKLLRHCPWYPDAFPAFVQAV